MNVTLKPCPFCGETPNEPYKDGGGDERIGYNFSVTIACKCGVSVSADSHQGNGGWCDDSGQALENAVKAWNKR